MPQVFAVAVSGNVGTGETQFKKFGKFGAKFIEAAMVAAVNECYAKGVTDPDLIRECMMEARKLAKEQLLELSAGAAEAGPEQKSE